MQKSRKRSLRNLTLALMFFLSSSVFLHAQRAAGSVGIGAQFGQPTGLSLKVYNPYGMSADVLAAWDLNDFFFLNVHGVFENHIGNSNGFHYFVGPGLFAGIRERGSRGDKFVDNNFEAGISGNFGLNYVIRRVEIYAQITPRLELLNETSGDIGGGVGVRFYFAK